MMIVLEILAVIFVAIAMALSLAHVLELPGKRRLDREQYLAVQRIYYPGFTIGGAAEPLGLVVLAALLAQTPAGSPRFWLVAGALAALVVVQLVFWTITQPVNRHWLQAQVMGAAARRFFGTHTGSDGAGMTRDWAALRDRWEHSHLLRAIAAMTAFVAIVIAVAI